MIRRLYFSAGAGVRLAGQTTIYRKDIHLAGDWIALAAERSGLPAPDLVGLQLHLAGEEFAVANKGGSVLYRGTYHVDPRHRPAQIEFRAFPGARDGKIWQGICQRSVDFLRICGREDDLGGVRPTRFFSQLGSGFVCLLFRRNDAA